MSCSWALNYRIIRSNVLGFFNKCDNIFIYNISIGVDFFLTGYLGVGEYVCQGEVFGKCFGGEVGLLKLKRIEAKGGDAHTGKTKLSQWNIIVKAAPTLAKNALVTN